MVKSKIIFNTEEDALRIENLSKSELNRFYLVCIFNPSNNYVYRAIPMKEADLLERVYYDDNDNVMVDDVLYQNVAVCHINKNNHNHPYEEVFNHNIDDFIAFGKEQDNEIISRYEQYNININDILA